AVLNGLFGGSAEDWIGRGTGVDDEGLARKRAAVETAVARLNGEKDPLEILRRVGGREIAAMVGLIIAARLQRVPVIIDGFVTTAAAAVVYAMDPSGLDHCLFAHVSAEAAHRRTLDLMEKSALLDFGMRLGEGSGAAVATGIVKAAAEMHSGMATFSDAGVASKDG
ncbi:MAG: nicotinate-nucleotide--dimethylbenzimidazole phosphoribosyltransferase, partial [Roseibium sp.]